MTEFCAATLKLGLRPRGWPHHIATMGRQVFQGFLLVKAGQHFLSVGLPVSGKMQVPPRHQKGGYLLDKRWLYQASLVVAFLVPGVWKKYLQGVD